MMHRIRHFIISLAAIVASGLIIASPALAEGGIGGRPASPDPNNPRSQSIFIYTLSGGQGKADKLFVNNATSVTKTIDLYTVDSTTSNTGAFTCKQKAEAITDAGAWVTLSQSKVTLESKQTTVVDLQVSVPAKADAGEHGACIVLQDESQLNQPTASGVSIATRQAVRVAITVPGDLTRNVSIESFKVGLGSGKEDYSVSLHNSGNVSADTDTQIIVKDMFGNTVYQNGGQYPVIRDSSLQLNYTGSIWSFFGGRFTATVSTKYDTDPTTFGVKDSGTLKTINGSEQVFWLAPSPYAIALVVALIIGCIWAWIYVKRRRKTDAKMRKS